METHSFNRPRVWRTAFLWMYPLVLLSGLLLRGHLGDVNISSLQTASEVFYVPCVFHWFTDWECPGCGITRSLIAMYLWHPTLSFYFHPLGPIIAFLTLFYWFSLLHKRIEDMWAQMMRWFGCYAYSALAVVLVWGVLRNF